MKTAIKNIGISLSRVCVMAFCIFTVITSGCAREQDTRIICNDARFSIALPTEWKITENKMETRILAEIPDEGGFSIIRQNVNVVVEETRAPISLNDYVESQIKGLQKLNGVRILIKGEAPVDGSAARWFTYSYTIHDFGYQALVYVVNKNNRFFVVTGISQFKNFQKYENRFHHIAQSFRFE